MTWSDAIDEAGLATNEYHDAVPSSLPASLLREIDRRLALLSEHFDMSALDTNGNTAAKIRKYYEDSRLGYQLVHSKEGAMHMALNSDGEFDRAGYEEQARLVAQRFSPTTVNVLELACGNGYNLGILARRHPDRCFTGVDLVRAQVDRANHTLRGCENAQAAVGDFQQLKMPDDRYDVVFVIESLCHSTDLPSAFREMRRVSSATGRVVVIDAWRTDVFHDLPPNVRRAAEMVERAMAVADAQQITEWERIARDSGLRIVENLDLTDQIVPNLERLANIADKRFLSHPVRARLLRILLPETLLTNAVSGYLMPLTVEAGAHTYRLITLDLM